jgi:hypothetical protein
MEAKQSPTKSNGSLHMNHFILQVIKTFLNILFWHEAGQCLKRGTCTFRIRMQFSPKNNSGTAVPTALWKLTVHQKSHSIRNPLMLGEAIASQSADRQGRRLDP